MKLKILVTGYTSLQCNTLIRHIKKIDVPALIVGSLRRQGHIVEWREAFLGEDLSSFDLVIVGVGPPLSLNANKMPSGLYALARAKRAIVFFDDWQVREVINGHRNLVKQGPKQFLKILLDKHIYRSRGLLEHQHLFDELLATSDEFHHVWNARWTPLIPAADWGDHSLVKLPAGASKPLAIDPSPLIALPDLDPMPKTQSWCLASIMPHADWVEKQHLTWPVTYYGARKYKAERLRSEIDVVRRYATHWGILSPVYPQAGSGWFRARALYAAHVGSVLLADPREYRTVSGAYTIQASDVERLSDGQRRALARDQGDALRAKLGTIDDFHARVADVVREATK